MHTYTLTHMHIQDLQTKNFNQFPTFLTRTYKCMLDNVCPHGCMWCERSARYTYHSSGNGSGIQRPSTFQCVLKSEKHVSRSYVRACVSA